MRTINTLKFQLTRINPLVQFFGVVITFIALAGLGLFFGQQNQIQAQVGGTGVLCSSVVLRRGDVVPPGYFTTKAACEKAKLGTKPINNCNTKCSYTDGCSCPGTCNNYGVVDPGETCGGDSNGKPLSLCQAGLSCFSEPVTGASQCVSTNSANRGISYCCPAGSIKEVSSGKCVPGTTSDNIPLCGGGLNCYALALSGSTQCQGATSADRLHCCPAGKVASNGSCVNSTNIPVCGSGLICEYGNPPRGSSKCQVNSAATLVMNCCPAGQEIKDGGCVDPNEANLPACGSGRSCSLSTVPQGSNKCRTTNPSVPVTNCCPSGQEIKDGVCKAPGTSVACADEGRNNVPASENHSVPCDLNGQPGYQCAPGYRAQAPLIGSLYCVKNDNNTSSRTSPRLIEDCNASCGTDQYCACERNCKVKTVITPDTINKSCGGAEIKCTGAEVGPGVDHAQICDRDGKLSRECKAPATYSYPFLGYPHCELPQTTGSSSDLTGVKNCRSNTIEALPATDAGAEKCQSEGAAHYQCKDGYSSQPTGQGTRRCVLTSSLPECGSGRICQANSFTGATQCRRGQGTNEVAFCCPAGQVMDSGQCAAVSTLPSCGLGRVCQDEPFSGAQACQTGYLDNPKTFCCPVDNVIVNGKCQAVIKPPSCSFGLYCSTTEAIRGASICDAGFNRPGQYMAAACCPLGQRIVNGACVTPSSNGGQNGTPSSTAAPATAEPGTFLTKAPGDNSSTPTNTTGSTTSNNNNTSNNPPATRPACRYTYSEWSECRAGLQNRQITKTEPANCLGITEPVVRVCGEEFYCGVDADCKAYQFCFQPPMRPCPAGTSCTQALPRKECQLRKAFADVNSDTRVNVLDLSAVVKNLLGTAGKADINGDSIIDMTDYSLLVRRLSEPSIERDPLTRNK